YYPGWKAYVDGKEEKIYQANYILRAVYLGPGKHDIRFIYDPLSFKVGTYISLITALFLLLVIIYRVGQYVKRGKT
ncbi:YfhO family protein, partial [bacterium]|nr:YfhO family protein [bacterium]